MSRTDWEGHFKFMILLLFFRKRSKILAFIFIQKEKSSSHMQSKTTYFLLAETFAAQAGTCDSNHNSTEETVYFNVHEVQLDKTYAEVKNGVVSSRVSLFCFPAVLVPSVRLVPLFLCDSKYYVVTHFVILGRNKYFNPIRDITFLTI